MAGRREAAASSETPLKLILRKGQLRTRALGHYPAKPSAGVTGATTTSVRTHPYTIPYPPPTAAHTVESMRKPVGRPPRLAEASRVSNPLSSMGGGSGF